MAARLSGQTNIPAPPREQKALAQIVRMERRRCAIIERIQPFDPKWTELNSKIKKEGGRHENPALPPLIALMLCDAGALREPVLYLSLFFKRRRADYYRLLQEVRLAGNWEAWMEFFLTGIAETAEQAADTAMKLATLCVGDSIAISKLGRAGTSTGRIHGLMQRRPIVSINMAAKETKMSVPTAGKALEILVSLGIVREMTGKQRDRQFVYSKYFALLDKGTEPLKV